MRRDVVIDIESAIIGSRIAQPQVAMSDPSPPLYEPRLHVVLHQPEIAYNTGSVGRTCVAVAGQAVAGPAAGLPRRRLLSPPGRARLLGAARLGGGRRLERAHGRPADPAPLAVHQEGRALVLGRRLSSRGDALVFGCESAGLPDSLQEQHPDTAAANPHQRRRSQPQSLECRGGGRLRSIAAMAAVVAISVLDNRRFKSRRSYRPYCVPLRLPILD